jgi:hypothetical protein
MNLYGSKAKRHMSEFCPRQYGAIEDREAYFTEIGDEAQRQVSSIYSKLSRPELGENDLASRLMAEETVRDLLYPTPEETGEDFDDEANPPAARALAWNQMASEELLDDR